MMVPMIDIKLAIVVYDSMNMSITAMACFGHQMKFETVTVFQENMGTVVGKKYPACVPVLFFWEQLWSV